MLGMFEKHDKEVYKLRRNMKYLEEFDEAYFVKGVYEEWGGGEALYCDFEIKNNII